VGDKNTGTWSSKLGLDAKLAICCVENIAVAKSEVGKTGWSNSRQILQNFLRKAMAQKRDVLRMMMITMKGRNCPSDFQRELHQFSY
jgi:hypothetical protein